MKCSLTPKAGVMYIEKAQWDKAQCKLRELQKRLDDLETDEADNVEPDQFPGLLDDNLTDAFNNPLTP